MTLNNVNTLQTKQSKLALLVIDEISMVELVSYIEFIKAYNKSKAYTTHVFWNISCGKFILVITCWTITYISLIVFIG